MGGGLSVPRLADQHVTLNPGRRALSFLSKALGFLFQTLVQHGCLYDTATLHIAAPFQRENKSVIATGRSYFGRTSLLS